jgi:ABC-2 type transport system ATP-binding protein
MDYVASIAIDNLSKNYGKFQALCSLSLEVLQGEVFGFLGPNGAGKTTTLRILMGILMPSTGSGSILGMDCFVDRVRLKRHVGYLPDSPFFYDHLTGWEMLRFIGDMHGLPSRETARRAERLLDELQLGDAADDYVTNYSLGMKKKMSLAFALLHEPSVLILDEPTTGLDPLASRQIRSLIRSFADTGRTVLLSTHWLEMAESLCDRVGIIRRGRLVAVGSPTELHAKFDDPDQRNTSLEEIFLRLTAEGELEGGT